MNDSIDVVQIEGLEVTEEIWFETHLSVKTLIMSREKDGLFDIADEKLNVAL